jgi:hypothetical protein
MDISRFLDFKNRWQLTKDAILWLICGLLLLKVGNLLENNFALRFPYIVYAPEPIRIAVFFLFLILLFMVFKDLFQGINIIFNKDKVYRFNSKDWPNKWIFNGKSELTDNAYLFVKSSRAGCLLKNYYWKDFRMNFEMKFDTNSFRNQKVIGLIFRAEDLDNYFMIEIGEKCYRKNDRNGDASGLQSLVRYKGGWEGTCVEESKKPFDFSNFTKVSLEVKDDTATLFLKGEPILNWIMPTHVDVNHVESGVKDNSEKTKDIIGGAFTGHVQRIPFRLKYGMVGFRAYMSQGAIIRSLKIESL